MKRALTFYLLLAGWSLCHAEDNTYKLGFDYIRANQNEPAAIETEIRASSFWKECLLNLDLPANTPRPFQFQMKVLLDGNFVLTTPDDYVKIGDQFSILGNDTSWKSNAMLKTYVNSRALGMTPALSKERIWLIHGKKGFKHYLRKGQENVPILEGYFGLPLDRLHKAGDIGWLLEESEGRDYHVLSDGDLSMIVIADADGRLLSLVPVDSRLLRNPGLAAWLGTQKQEVADRLQKMKDALDTPAKEIISAELKMYWKALRAVVEESHFKVIPFDTIDFRSGVTML